MLSEVQLSYSLKLVTSVKAHEYSIVTLDAPPKLYPLLHVSYASALAVALGAASCGL